VPLAETLGAFGVFQRRGLIRRWGVNYFELDDMQEVVDLPGGSEVATDQVLYNLTGRGIEHEQLPWCRTRGLPIMAYSPTEQGRLSRDAVLGSRRRRETGYGWRCCRSAGQSEQICWSSA
jgi:aryl-alcohol dehydrogenase-like predicted oxidoreductase